MLLQWLLLCQLHRLHQWLPRDRPAPQLRQWLQALWLLLRQHQLRQSRRSRQWLLQVILVVRLRQLRQARLRQLRQWLRLRQAQLMVRQLRQWLQALWLLLRQAQLMVRQLRQWLQALWLQWIQLCL
jgi:hypothetical protein